MTNIVDKMDEVNTTLFGPIAKDYCIYFYILSVVAAVNFILFIIGMVLYGMKKKMDIGFFVIAIIYSGSVLLQYLQNRLLYNMCQSSLGK